MVLQRWQGRSLNTAKKSQTVLRVGGWSLQFVSNVIMGFVPLTTLSIEFPPESKEAQFIVG